MLLLMKKHCLYSFTIRDWYDPARHNDGYSHCWHYAFPDAFMRHDGRLIMRSFPRTAFWGTAVNYARDDLCHADDVPTAICMAFEMATYGLIIGLLFAQLRPQSLTTIYISRSL